jgi:uncharacterized protein
MERNISGAFVVALVLSSAVNLFPGHRPAEAAEVADEVVSRKVSIMSEGVRIQADVYSLGSLEGKRLPTIIMAHGWGGTASMLRPQASDFARAGYLVVAFDYRGWGDSDSRVVLTAPRPTTTGGTRFTADVMELREVVDPLDQVTDFFNVVHWAVGEQMVDAARIGLWGTSYSGGHVVHVAAYDSRVKAVVSQVGYMDSRSAYTQNPQALGRAYSEATRRARGELGYPPPRAREVGNLVGGPIREKFLRYAPVGDVPRITDCALLLIVAENEELFDNREHAALAYQRASEPKKYVVIPGISHYGIYGEARAQATGFAIAWFDQYLKR